MTKEECQEILDILVGAYPTFLNSRDPKSVFKAWYRSLRNSSYEETLKNIDRWIDENNYPPTISSIKPWEVPIDG